MTDSTKCLHCNAWIGPMEAHGDCARRIAEGRALRDRRSFRGFDVSDADVNAAMGWSPEAAAALQELIDRRLGLS